MRENKKGVWKLGILIAGIALVIISAELMAALSDDERTALQSELDNLTSSLADSGYSWLDLPANLNINDNLILSFDNKILSI